MLAVYLIYQVMIRAFTLQPEQHHGKPAVVHGVEVPRWLRKLVAQRHWQLPGWVGKRVMAAPVRGTLQRECALKLVSMGGGVYALA